VPAPGNVAEVPPENGKEPEDFDTEQGEAEDMGGAGETGGEDCGGHEGGVGGEGGGESSDVISNTIAWVLNGGFERLENESQH